MGRGDTYLLTAADKWQLEVLQESGFLLEDIQKEISKRTRLQEKEIKEAFEEAGVRALAYDDRIYRAAGLNPPPLLRSPYLLRLMQRNYEATLHEWRNFTRTIAEQSQRLFISECDRAYHLVSSGALGYTQAVKESVERIAAGGVRVTYPSGHTDTIETATLRCVRTGISQMSGQIQLARAKETGVNLVLVSSHLGARPSHEVWQGRIYSIDWNKVDIFGITK